jgi:hypothetical protein
VLSARSKRSVMSYRSSKGVLQRAPR